MDLSVAEQSLDGGFMEELIGSLPLSVAILDTDGTVLATNQAWQSFAEANDCQMSPAMVGVNYLDVTDAADDIFATRAATGLRAVLYGESEQVELEYPCHSPDENRWFVLRARQFTYEGDRYVTVVHVDITERKERERELERYRQLVEGMGDPAAILDEDGQYEIVNQALARFRDSTPQALESEQSPLVQWLRTEAEGDPYRGLFEDTRDELKGEFTRDHSERGCVTVEYQLSRLTVEGETAGVVAIYRDITERKEQAAQLRETQEALRSIQQTMASTRPFTERIEEVLEYGRAYLDVEQGFFTRIDTDTMEIRVAAGPNEQLQVGESVPLSEAYCQHTIEASTSSPLTVEHAREEGWADDPAFERFNLDCYIGTTVLVDGEPYGTISFADRTPVDGPFTEHQQTFVELLTEWVSYELGQRTRKQQYRRLTDRITDAHYTFDADWTVTYWNEVVAERTGVPAEDIVGRDFWEVFPELRGTDYEETLREASESGEPQSCKFYYDSDDYWIEVQAYPDEDGLTVISQEITKRKEHQQEQAYRRALLEAQAEASIDGLLLTDSDQNVRYYNDRFLDIWNISDETAAERSNRKFLESARHLLAQPDKFQEKVEYLHENPAETSRDTIELNDGRWIDRYSAPVIGDDGIHYGRLSVFRDVTECKERERTLAQQRDELAQLQRLNTLVREIIQALQDTATRDGIETAVCEHLTDSDLYQTVWIGRRSESTDQSMGIIPQTAVGVDDAYLEGIQGGEPGPAKRALQSGDVQVIDEIATADRFPEYRRDTALAHDHHSLAAVPLITGQATYGVLVVYAPQSHTISIPEKEVLAGLGQSIALAIQRVHSRRSLTAETVVALDLCIPDAEFPFATVSSDLECELTLERRIPIDNGRTIYYIRVDGADPTQVCGQLKDSSLVADSSVVRAEETNEPPLIETHLEESYRLPLDVLTDHGASMKSAHAVDGDITLSVELPPEVDIQSVLMDLREIVPDIRVVSKHHVDRPITTVAGMQNTLADQLTPKQEASLMAASARGYYEWPRDTTVEELADTFDISSPALHYRLRKAHQTVITTLLGDEKH
ncbi:MAG: PAS domain-containing protein [Haloarcula sp.]